MRENLLEQRAARKAEIAARLGWNSYSHHDRAAVEQRIHRQWSLLRARADVELLAGRYVPVPDLRAWIAADFKRYVRRCGGQSKHVPHQGARECARRLRQSGICA